MPINSRMRDKQFVKIVERVLSQPKNLKRELRLPVMRHK